MADLGRRADRKSVMVILIVILLPLATAGECCAQFVRLAVGNRDGRRLDVASQVTGEKTDYYAESSVTLAPSCPVEDLQLQQKERLAAPQGRTASAARPAVQ